MLKYLHIASAVERRIENLRKSGKWGIILAQKAESIISSMTAGGLHHHMDEPGSCTKYGENRIKKCWKYDLGCGFRLIALKRGINFYFPFIGTHDECQRWLARHSRLKEFTAVKGTWVQIVSDDGFSGRMNNFDSADRHQDAEQDLMPDLSDREMRSIFRGLVEAIGKGTP